MWQKTIFIAHNTAIIKGLEIDGEYFHKKEWGFKSLNMYMCTYVNTHIYLYIRQFCWNLSDFLL